MSCFVIDTYPVYLYVGDKWQCGFSLAVIYLQRAQAYMITPVIIQFIRC